MVTRKKVLDQVLRGTADSNVSFHGLCSLLQSLGFEERIKGSHHIFTREGALPEEAMTTEPRYEVIIYWSDEDEAFIAEVPELAGCASDGRTYEEARYLRIAFLTCRTWYAFALAPLDCRFRISGMLANVQVIIEEWIETARKLGRTIPEPRGRLIFA